MTMIFSIWNSDPI